MNTFECVTHYINFTVFEIQNMVPSIIHTVYAFVFVTRFQLHTCVFNIKQEFLYCPQVSRLLRPHFS